MIHRNDMSLIVELTRDRWNRLFGFGGVLCGGAKFWSSCLTRHSKSLLLPVRCTIINIFSWGWPFSSCVCHIVGHRVGIKLIQARFLNIDHWLFLSSNRLSLLMRLSNRLGQRWSNRCSNIEPTLRTPDSSQHRGMLTVVTTNEWCLRPWRWWKAAARVLLRRSDTAVFPSSRPRELLRMMTLWWWL